MNLARAFISALNRVTHPLGYEFRRIKGSGSLYIDAALTIRAAQDQGVSVCEYVEALWNQRGCTDRVIDEMNNAGSLSHCNRVCEIGPGTGRYLERVNKWVTPKIYDIYETANDWATWLAQTYAPPVVHRSADGHTLQQTPDSSCGLVHAHGVFVYLSYLHAFEYFKEIARVCAPGGFVVFDFFSDEDINMQVINNWLKTSERYPVILSRRMVIQYFKESGFSLIHEFDKEYGHGLSHYLILRQTEN